MQIRPHSHLFPGGFKARCLRTLKTTALIRNEVSVSFGSASISLPVALSTTVTHSANILGPYSAAPGMGWGLTPRCRVPRAHGVPEDGQKPSRSHPPLCISSSASYFPPTDEAGFMIPRSSAGILRFPTYVPASLRAKLI